jgi:hypothetical protein
VLSLAIDGGAARPFSFRSMEAVPFILDRLIPFTPLIAGRAVFSDELELVDPDRERPPFDDEAVAGGRIPDALGDWSAVELEGEVVVRFRFSCDRMCRNSSYD